MLQVTYARAMGEPAKRPNIEVHVDLTDAPRHLIHVRETLPVVSGEQTLFYPKWIPGTHEPCGPIDNLTGLYFRGDSDSSPVLPWRRDPVDPYTFHVEIPKGVTSLVVDFDYLQVSSRSSSLSNARGSSHVLTLETANVVLYPAGQTMRNIYVSPSIHLASSWTAATALRAAPGSEPVIHGRDASFGAVSLEEFIDSPILAGDHCRQYPLAPELQPKHTLDVCAEKASDLDLKPALLQQMSALVRQATLLFQSNHYRHYDFLVAVSPYISADSIEHTQSSDDIVKSLDPDDPNNPASLGYLLSHEFTHSWCGKYRRPVGMATLDFQAPQKTGLLWVYEGLTEYYGDVLAARAGFRTPAQVLDRLDQAVYQVDQPGRNWRPLQDTADASPILRVTDPAWASWRLNQDYYQEGALAWLEVDVRIRQISKGTKSLDTFAASFLGKSAPGGIGQAAPGVVPYSFDDVVDALNRIAPYDWATFWSKRLNTLSPKPPTNGLEEAGYSYVDSLTMVPDEAAVMQATHMAEMFHSLGIFVLPDGTLRDVWMHSPAFDAGLGPGDKLTAVNGEPYSPETLVKAVQNAKGNGAAIKLTAMRDDESATYRIDYHGGERYASLRRNDKPDVLTTVILQPLK